LLESEPSRLDPSKKSTRLTVPSTSEAVAVIVMFLGASKLALFVGELIVTAGCALIVTMTGLDIVVLPKLSLALALREEVPAGGFVQVSAYGRLVASPILFVAL